MRTTAHSLPPSGFRYAPGFLAPDEEKALLERVAELPFEAFKFQGYTARRRVVSYGYHYSFENYRLAPSKPIPAFLDGIVAKAAAWTGREPGDFAEALVTEYPAGAAIGWHRDVKPFDLVVGISLGSPCKMSFRKGEAGTRETRAVLLEPRSAYLLSGEARELWEHRIRLTPQKRYSITLRTLKKRLPAVPKD